MVVSEELNLFFVSHKGGIVLQLDEIKRLMEMPVRKLYVLRLTTNERVNFLQELSQHFSHWLNGSSKIKARPSQEQEYLDEEVDHSIKA